MGCEQGSLHVQQTLAKPLNENTQKRRKETRCGLRLHNMEIQLPDVPLVIIFSYLDVISLLQSSQVCKVRALHPPLLSE
jgi:hypothetical protein